MVRKKSISALQKTQLHTVFKMWRDFKRWTSWVNGKIWHVTFCTSGIKQILNGLCWIKEKQENDLYLCHDCKSCCSIVPVMHRGGNNGDEYNRLFHRPSFPGHLILSTVFRTFSTELMITDCHIILFIVTCLGRFQKFYSLKSTVEERYLLNWFLMVMIMYSGQIK